ncbi:hypothetical protein BVE84_08640 [Streptococcus azizii]|uniref:Bacteriocin immunity protein n=1 Tax=Streptococcus azizii TaxID=1579424 RepID=A0AB36JP56_9STRE|nr:MULTISPECIES: hypothetical protein [Streptococcus]MBF0776663.1 hypothetical protein [Streptococcus sp. 19428wD3_AN2]ONK25878.1 hypothetical protein BVE86_08870 [Streptococcus azizii]ONK26264.1 hypothetical protein BVE85_08715 [Streptococcus azizii]ONK27044.1 hypothetical protein BVE84_08640 [Streptococcus azizii]TFU82613.1 hypothetical protein E4T83_07915 [Streptococcus sp. AN2]
MDLLKNFSKYVPEISIFTLSLVNTIWYVLDDLKVIEAPHWVSLDVSVILLFLMLMILLYKDRRAKN